MKAWLVLLGGMINWAAHFFAIYIVGITIMGTTAGRLLVGAITIACLGANAGLFVRARRWRGEDDVFSDWMSSAGLVILLLSSIAIVWQGLPALIS